MIPAVINKQHSKDIPKAFQIVVARSLQHAGVNVTISRLLVFLEPLNDALWLEYGDFLLFSHSGIQDRGINPVPVCDQFTEQCWGPQGLHYLGQEDQV